MSSWRSQRWRRSVAVVLVAGTALGAGLAPSRSAADERSGAAGHSAPRPVPVGNTFPIPAPHDVSFSDSWHACRDGCRRQHKGNDLMADEGTPMVAVEAGVIARVDDVDDSNGGRSIWLLGDSGVAYWYAHNSANLVVAGQPVARGQVIARVGHTGNARTTPPHIHFQVNTCGELSSSEPCTVDPHEALRAWPQELIDGGADALGLYTPTDASFRLRTDGGSPLPARPFGSAGGGVGEGGEGGGLPVAGDWDGDGRDTVGVYRPADATFLRSDDAGTPLPPVRYGQPGDLPVVGDWDGDGRDSVGHYRPTTATFHLYDEAGRALPPVPFGTPVVAPAPATRPAAAARPATVVRSGVNLAAVARAAGPPVPSGTTFVEPSPEPDAGAAGPPAIVPVAGDWDGDRRDTLALFRPADATFVVRDDSGAARPAARYGHPGDLPLVGDWDGDGRDTLGVYRAPEASYHLQGFTDREPAAGPGVARVRAEVGDGLPAAPAAVQEPDGPVVFGPAGAPGAQPVAGDWNGHDLVTADDLHAIFGAAPGFDEAALAEDLPLLNQVLVRSGAVSPARKAALLVTLHHESGLRHDAVGSGSSRWRGRGFVQLTGEADYRQAGRDLRIDLAADPDLAVDPAVSAEIASWRWTVAGNLNHAADRLDVAAVAIALGYRSDPAEDRARCDDFRRALTWFSGGATPAGVNCERTPEAIATAQEAMEPARPATGADGPEVPADLPHPPGPLDTAPAGPPVVSPPPGPTPSPTTTRPPTRPSPPTGPPPTAPPTMTTTTTTTPPSTTTTTTSPPDPTTTTTTTSPEPPATTTTSEPPATTTTVATEPAPPGA